MFELRDVSVSFGSRPILHGLSTRIEPGVLTVVAGPNGAGKSTVLKVLTGELAPNSGEAFFEGQRLAKMTPAAMAARRAVLPQSAQLNFPFTVLEVVRLGLETRRDLSPDARNQIARKSLERVDLSDFGGRHYQQLSGGEQQRVHLARVLCQLGEPVVDGCPQFIFLDEPTSSLDIRHQISTLEIARGLARAGAGVLAVLHDLNLAAAFADRLLVMRAGQLYADGHPREVMTDALISDVFGIPLRVGHLPTGMPYILPQTLVGMAA